MEQSHALREAAMADSRRLLWTDLARRTPMVELGKVYIGGRYDDKAGVFLMGRVRWCEHCNQWEVAQTLSVHQCSHEEAWITHLAPDIMGTPR